MLNEPDYVQLGKKLETYCQKYSIPVQHFFEIINDQKVIPMLRGKGMEYNAVLILRHILDSQIWEVNKLNLAAQPGTPDQDIGLTHRRTNIRLIVESKSAIRGSMTSGVRNRIHKIPHFKVKSHRSRSNLRLQQTGNDRYSISSFDVLITNPFNAIIKGGTVGEELELLDDPNLTEILYKHYQVSDEKSLLLAVSGDWRFVLPPEIAENNLIPRTPTVYLSDDPHWLLLSELQRKIEEVVQERYTQARKKSGRN